MDTPEDSMLKSFHLTTIQRINKQPEFRREILRQVLESISEDSDLEVAYIMLGDVIEADKIKGK